ILNAIKKQAESQLIFTYAFPSDPRCRLLEKLVALAPPGLDKAIVFSAGTEATECAISLMRKHGLQISPQKVGIMSFEQCYHGRTLSAKCAGGAPGLVDGIPRENVFHTLLPI